jgi:hypothetical protein
MSPAENPIDVLQRWEEGGAVWRAVAVGDEHVSIDLCACTGEPVDRLDSDDAQLIDYVRSRGGASDA